jgi:hypothetical protein
MRLGEPFFKKFVPWKGKRKGGIALAFFKPNDTPGEKVTPNGGRLLIDYPAVALP